MRGDMYSDRTTEDLLDSIGSIKKTFLLIEKELLRASIAWIDSNINKIEEREKARRVRDRRSRERAGREVRSVEIEEYPEECPEETSGDA